MYLKRLKQLKMIYWIFYCFVAKLHWHKLHLDKNNVNSEFEFFHTSESKFQTINIVKIFQHRKYLCCQIKKNTTEYEKNIWLSCIFQWWTYHDMLCIEYTRDSDSGAPPCLHWIYNFGKFWYSTQSYVMRYDDEHNVILPKPNWIISE